jgi:elongation factor Ts
MAEEIIAKSGMKKVQKTASRTAAEGVIQIALSADNKQAAMVEINCETDFVGRDVNFLEFCDSVGKAVLAAQVTDIANIHDLKLSSGLSLEEARKALITKIGENIQVRRAVCANVTEGVIGAYTHGGRIGAMVHLSGNDAALAKDVAMQVAAMNPLYAKPENVPEEMKQQQMAILREKAKDSR